MAKKSKIKQNLLFNVVAILFALVSVCMIFTNVCGIASDGNVGYILTGLQSTFGFSETKTLIGTVVYTGFSFLNLIPYLLLLVGIVLALLRVLKVLKSGAIDWAVAAMFVVSGVMFFLIPNFVVYGAGWATLVDLALKTGATKALLVGGYVGGISALLAGISVVAGKFAKK